MRSALPRDRARPVGVSPTSRPSTDTVAPGGVDRIFRRPPVQICGVGVAAAAASAFRAAAGGFGGRTAAGSGARVTGSRVGSQAGVLLACHIPGLLVVSAAAGVAGALGTAGTAASVNSRMASRAWRSPWCPQASRAANGQRPRSPLQSRVTPTANASTNGHTADRDRSSIVSSLGGGGSASAASSAISRFTAVSSFFDGAGSSLFGAAGHLSSHQSGIACQALESRGDRCVRHVRRRPEQGRRRRSAGSWISREALYASTGVAARAQAAEAPAQVRARSSHDFRSLLDCWRRFDLGSRFDLGTVDAGVRPRAPV